MNKKVIKVIGHLSLEEYLNRIKPYLKDITSDLQESDTWKIQLTVAISFISPKDADEERVMHSESNNVKSTIMQMKFLIKPLSHFFQFGKINAKK